MFRYITKNIQITPNKDNILTLIHDMNILDYYDKFTGIPMSYNIYIQNITIIIDSTTFIVPKTETTTYLVINNIEQNKLDTSNRKSIKFNFKVYPNTKIFTVKYTSFENVLETFGSFFSVFSLIASIISNLYNNHYYKQAMVNSVFNFVHYSASNYKILKDDKENGYDPSKNKFFKRDENGKKLNQNVINLQSNKGFDSNVVNNFASNNENANILPITGRASGDSEQINLNNNPNNVGNPNTSLKKCLNNSILILDNESNNSKSNMPIEKKENSTPNFNSLIDKNSSKGFNKNLKLVGNANSSPQKALKENEDIDLLNKELGKINDFKSNHKLKDIRSKHKSNEAVESSPVSIIDVLKSLIPFRQKTKKEKLMNAAFDLIESKVDSSRIIKNQLDVLFLKKLILSKNEQKELNDNFALINYDEYNEGEKYLSMLMETDETDLLHEVREENIEISKAKKIADNKGLQNEDNV